MLISEDIIRRVRESTDIVEVISEYVSLKKTGATNFFGNCPFHEEKTPSFSVHTQRQTYHCFGCGEGGNAFTFLMKIEGIEFPDAVRRLAERAGIEVVEEGKKPRGDNEELYRANELAMKFYRYHLTDRQGPEIEFARDYLTKRGITPDLQETFKIGLAPDGWDELIKVAAKRRLAASMLEKAGLARKHERGTYYDWFRGRLMFPIFNPSGRVVAFGGRILHDDPDKPQPKYVNTPDTPIYRKGHLVYGLIQARDAMRQEGSAILVEGYTDLIALHRAGFRHAVAGLGTALTPDQANLIKRFAPRVVMLYDADNAGDMAAFRGADILIGQGLEVMVALMPAGEDPDTLVQKGGAEAIEEVLTTAEPLVDFKIGFFRRRGGLDSPQRRSEATHALLETITRIEDPITRQYALHDAAEKLGVDERTLLSEMQRQRSRAGSGRRGGSVVQTEAPVSFFEETLRNLIYVLVHHPEHRSEMFNYFHAADIDGHPLQPVVKWIEGAHIDGQKVGEADLYDSLGNDPELTRRLGKILNRPGMGDESYVSTIVHEAPIVLRIHGIRQEMARIREAQKAGSSPDLLRRIQELRNELNELEQQRTGH